MKTKLGQLIFRQIIGLQKKLKLVSLSLEAETETKLHLRVCFSDHDRKDYRLKEMAVLPIFLIISKLL
jgi:hypothetical protein